VRGEGKKEKQLQLRNAIIKKAKTSRAISEGEHSRPHRNYENANVLVVPSLSAHVAPSLSPHSVRHNDCCIYEISFYCRQQLNYILEFMAFVAESLLSPNFNKF